MWVPFDIQVGYRSLILQIIQDLDPLPPISLFLSPTLMQLAYIYLLFKKVVVGFLF